MPNPFPHDITPPLQPSGPFLSIAQGGLEARVYQNSGLIELAAPDLAGNAKANLIRYAAALHTPQQSLVIGVVASSQQIAGTLEVKQKAGNAVVTARLSFPHDSVMRYEVTDWGGLHPVATAITAPSDGGEHFYGFGERFDAFDQAGKSIHMLAFDQPGTKIGAAYKVSPWFISTRGYGLHLDSSAESIFDMRASAGDHYTVTNALGALKFNVVYGPQLPAVLSRFTAYAGRPPLPPPWLFGPWISSDIWRSGGEVRYAVTLFREHGIPASGFVFDSPWEIAYNDFRFNMTQFGKDATIDGRHFSGFGSLAEMMAFLQTNGLKVVCWMAPFINTTSANENVPGQNLGKAANYEEAAQNNFFVRSSPGGPALIVRWWKGSGSPLDFTSAGARNWLANQLRALITAANVHTASGGTETAIGAFKTDDGESGNGPNTYIPATAQYSDGRTGVEMRNAYCFEYHKAIWGVLGVNGALFARSGFVGSQGLPSSWAGDNEPNFGPNGLPSVIVAGQSAAMSGYAIWGHDTGGYQDRNFSVSPPNLFMRWTQFGCFSPIMQMHRQVATERQYPWRYGDAALENYRFFARLHTRLFPYVYTYAKQASDTGLPIIRPLVLMHQTDPNTFGLRHVYHFGDEFLVAPIVTPNANERIVYLPAGEWIDFWTNERHAGGQNITCTNANQSQFPLFVRKGAMIPMLPTDVGSLCSADYVNNAALKTAGDSLVFRVYPGGASQFTMFDGTILKATAGAGSLSIKLSSAARLVQFEIITAGPQRVVRDGAPLIKFTAPSQFDAQAAGWTVDGLIVRIKFDHAGGDTAVDLT